MYEKVIAHPDTTGSKYCQSVYIGYAIDGKMEICHISITGAALGAWIDFRKKTKVFEGAITVNEMVEGKKGITIYQIPIFKMIPVKPETDAIAKELDKELQEYLSAYFKTKAIESTGQVTEAVTEVAAKREEIIAPVQSLDGNMPSGVYVSDSNDDLPF